MSIFDFNKTRIRDAIGNLLPRSPYLQFKNFTAAYNAETQTVEMEAPATEGGIAVEGGITINLSADGTLGIGVLANADLDASETVTLTSSNNHNVYGMALNPDPLMVFPGKKIVNGNAVGGADIIIHHNSGSVSGGAQNRWQLQATDGSSHTLKPGASMDVSYNYGSVNRWVKRPELFALIESVLTSDLPSIVGRRDGELRRVAGFSAVGDPGAGAEYRWKAGDPTTADGVLVINGTGGRWRLVWDGRSLYAGYAGFRPDTKYIADGVRSAGQYTLTSATAAFTADDVGKRVLINEPSDPCTGTVSLGAGGHTITGTGTNFLSIPRESFDATAPIGGGAVWIGSSMYVIRYIGSDTSAIVLQTLGSGSGLTLYKETQTEAVIVSRESATQVTLDVAAAVSKTGLTVAYGTDNDEAIDLFDEVCHANNIREARFPSGHIGFYENHTFGAESTDPDWATKRRVNRTYIGAGYDRTVFSRLRKASWETAFPPADPAALAWILPDKVALRGFSETDNIPVLGVRHSTGGVSNASGGRVGIMMRHPYECTMEQMGGPGYASRDEHLYMDSSYATRGNQIKNCYIPMANGNAINPNSGYLAGTVVSGCDAGSFWTALNMAVSDGICIGNRWRGQKDVVTGNDIVVLEAAAKLNFSDNVVETANMSEYSSSGVTVFGSVSPTARILISNLRIRDIDAIWHQPATGGALTFLDFAGVALVQGLTVSECTALTAGGRHILVTGANTGSVDFQQVSLSGGTNLTLGLEVNSDVPAGAVSGQRNIACVASITSPVVAAAAKFADVKIVSAGGTTVIGSRVRNVDVEFNGSATTELRDPATMPEGETIYVSNASTQLGTTSVTAEGGATIVGSTSLAGAGAFGGYRVFGNTYRKVA